MAAHPPGGPFRGNVHPEFVIERDSYRPDAGTLADQSQHAQDIEAAELAEREGRQSVGARVRRVLRRLVGRA